MTAIDERTTSVGARPATKGEVIVKYMTTTDHKLIGHLYLLTSFTFFLIGGAMAMVMRTELARPGLQVVDEEIDQPFKGDLFFVMAVRPERDELVCARVPQRAPEAVQVLQPLGKQRVTFDVIEEIAIGRRGEDGKPSQRLGRKHLR